MRVLVEKKKKNGHDLRRLSRAHRYARKQERTAGAPMASFVVVEWYHTDMGPMRWASGRMQAPCMEDSLTACDPEIIT